MNILVHNKFLNQQGATLMEVVVGFTIVSIITAAVLTSVLSGFSLSYKTKEEYDRVTDVYTQIESYDAGIPTSKIGSMKFSWSGSSSDPIEVEGTYMYDSNPDQSKLAEFIGDW